MAGKVAAFENGKNEKKQFSQLSKSESFLDLNQFQILSRLCLEHLVPSCWTNLRPRHNQDNICSPKAVNYGYNFKLVRLLIYGETFADAVLTQEKLYKKL